jgi:glycosyltransferase involved in cell wall biosynthesis
MQDTKAAIRSLAGRIFRNSDGDLRPFLLTLISGNGIPARLLLAIIQKYSGSRLKRQAISWARALEPRGMLSLSSAESDQHGGLRKVHDLNVEVVCKNPQIPREAKMRGGKSSRVGRLGGLEGKAISARSVVSSMDGNTIIHITHNLGGGTELHVQRLTKELISHTPTLVLNVTKLAGKNIIGMVSGPNFASFRVRIKDTQDIRRILEFFNVAKIHYHHFHGLEGLFLESGLLDIRPYYFTAHDFYAVCPRVNLLKPNGVHCKVVYQRECSTCLSEAPLVQCHDIDLWRRFGSRMLAGAERVICPTVNAASYLNKLVEREYCVVPHDGTVLQSSILFQRKLRESEKLTVGVLGILTPHKGVEFLEGIMKDCASLDRGVDFAIIGDCSPSWRRRLSSCGNLKVVTGRYSDRDVDRMIRSVSPDVILFTSRWPETFSYTLSEALVSGLPIIAPSIGAFPERLSGREWTWIYEYQVDPMVVAQIITSVKAGISSGQMPIAPGYEEGNHNFSRFDSSFYVYEYLDRPRPLAN